MSDPARDGYECHGPMTAIVDKLVGGETIGHLCEECGVTRNALHREHPMRGAVDAYLYALASRVPGWARDRRMRDLTSSR